MKEADFKLIRRSFIYRMIFTLVGTCFLMSASYYNVIYFGLIVTGIISLPFFFIISSKFFPDSTDFFSSKYKNFSRERKGLDLIPEDSNIKGDHFDDYRRG
ncbi:hypothetical protein OAF35_04325 [Verrucomicrobiales bacterium]|nr:hypothetical protein [Verrucomicrobiales bacterium]|tara:strand:- start:646 stop:948 length:303 start_codon:yes stop_codon:yes gene_type:complete